MREHDVCTTGGPSRARRNRRNIIAAGLAVGSLLLAGCGSDKTSTPPPSAGLGHGDISLKTGGADGLGGGSGSGGSGGGSGSESNVDRRPEIAAMKPCSMVDVKPLAAALKAGINVAPKDIPTGYSLEPDGVTCAGQMKGQFSSSAYVSFSTFEFSVVPFSTQTVAKQQASDRLQKTGSFKGAQAPVPLEGDWDEGTLVVGQDDYESFALALVRKDTYLVKVYLNVIVTGDDVESLSVARESFRPVIVKQLTSLYDGVNSNLDG